MRHSSLLLFLLLCCGCFFSKKAKRPSKQLKAIEDIRLDKEELKHWLDEPLPPFIASSINGDSIYSDSLRGKKIMLNLFFSKCSPCILEIKHLNKLKEHYHKQNIEFLAMTYEDASTAMQFAQKYEYTFTIIPDFLEYYEPLIRYYPQNIFIDSKGIIRAVKGSVPLDLNALMPTVDAPFDIEDMIEHMDPTNFYKIIDAME
ncbi:MAG: TlpA disulfide reductase family protein [Bacteroidota bacterium]